ncbi:choice-of-anchor U domain-containing protein [Ramlibacter sp. AN1133]|uniref:choice-of-anchor U domain-containing protein n=1 Tax=Ramlibacter sp. AN1133 TaxID=3133429 RepID=UPI0030C364F8
MANPDSTQFGSPGNDSLVGADFSNDSIVGQGGNDNISGLGGADTLEGGDGNDFLSGGAGDDLLLGGAGGDALQPGAGSDTVDGGAILDRTNYTDGNTVNFTDAAAAVVLDLNGPRDPSGAQVGTATIGADVDRLVNVNFVVGSAFGDNLKGTAEFDLFEQFEGREGNDTIDGGAIDSLGTGSNRANYNSAPAGVIVTLGGAGNGTAQDGYGSTDTLLNINQVRGSGFADQLTGSDTTAFTESFEGRGGNDTIDGKGGVDQVRYDSATTGVTVNLATHTATDGIFVNGVVGTDTLLNIEGARGGNFDDQLTGSDTTGMTGSPGDFEFFTGQGGNDVIDGGGGFDRADYNTALFGVFVDLAAGTAQDGQGGTDTLANIEAVRGGDFNDVLFGSDTTPFESFEGRRGNDLIDGRGGVDRIDYQADFSAVSVDLRFGMANDGFGGTDTLVNMERVRGSGFADTIIGGGGDDTLEGGGGSDTLSGSGGNDTFLYLASGGPQGQDLITDFNAGDVIELRTSLTAGASTAGDGSTVGGNGLQVSAQAGVTTLAFDLDGVAGAELRIQLAGVYDATGFTIANAGTGPSFVTYSATGAITPTRVSGFPSLGNAGDTIAGSTSADTLTGGRADDVINGADGNDSLQGGDGNDTLNGGNGNDVLLGGAGSDTLFGNAGNDTLDGGEITDRVNYTDLNFAGYNGVTVVGVDLNLATGIVTIGAEQDRLANINFVQGSAQNDTITGSSVFNLFEQFEGLAGNDTIDGGAIDPLGTSGNRASYASSTASVSVDLALGQALNDGFGTQDTLININFVRGGSAADTLLGSDRTDQTELFDGRGGNDFIDGRGGIDIARYDGANAPVNVNLATGTAQDGFGGTDTLAGIEGVRGSNFNDILTGGNTANDTLEIFQGNGGNDIIDGGSGFDRADYTTATFGVNVDLTHGTAQDGQGGFDSLVNIEGVRGSELNDVLIGSDRTDTTESFEGRAGDDFIDGRAGSDRVEYQNDWAGVRVDLQAGSAQDGFGGRDTLINVENVRGSTFDDVILGSAASNVLQGNAGNDVLEGRGGDDTLAGGAGVDEFRLAAGPGGIDRIADIEAGEKIILGVDRDLVNGFLTGTDPTGLLGGQVMFSNLVAGTTQVFIGIDDIAGADMSFQLTGTFNANDFVWAPNDTDGAALLYRPAATNLPGSAGSEWVYGSNFNDTLAGQDGNDTLLGYAGNDAISAGAGDDEILGDAGNDTIDGGLGFDRLHYELPGAMTAPIRADLTAQSVTSGAETDVLTSIEALSGSNFNDTIVGALESNFLAGAGGNDLVLGQATAGNVAGGAYQGGATGGDVLEGGAGDDTIQGGTGNDELRGGTSDFNGPFPPAGGADTFVFLASGNGVDRIVDFSSNDVIRVASPVANTTVQVTGSGPTAVTTLSIDTDGVAGAEIQIDLAGAFAPAQFAVTSNGDGTSSIRYVVPETLGTAGNDQMFGTPGDDSIVGLGGDDNLSGGPGDDTLVGGDGNDFFNPDSGDDSVNGGAGFDGVGYDNASASVNINLQSGQATGASIGVDTLVSVESAIGSHFNDSIVLGNSGGFTNGRAGNDLLQGGAGNDNFVGGSGNDTIIGNGGSDGVAYFDDGGDGGPPATGSGVNVNLGTGIAVDNWGNTDSLSGISAVTGSGFNDTLVGHAGNNFFDGGAGNDSIDGGAGFDSIGFNNTTGGVNVNLLAGTATGGGVGNDTLVSIESVNGTNFDDTVQLGNAPGSNANGRGGNDTILGGGGDDFITGGSGNDSIVGGAGFDTADYNPAFDNAGVPLTGVGVTVNLATGIATDNWGHTDSLSGIELVRGSDFADHLTGGNPANGSGATDGFEGFTGQGGNDTIDGGTGFDRAQYDTSPNAVNVTLGGTSSGTAQDGFGGIDTLISIEEVRGSSFGDTLTGSDSGVFESFEGRGGNDFIDGKGGVDRVSYQTSGSGVNVDLAAGTASDGFGGTDTLSNIENIRGSESGDVLAGNAGANDIEARAGNDLLQGGAGQDTLRGGAGDDTLDGGSQVILSGWDATANTSGEVDIASYQDAGSGVTIRLGTDGTAGTATGGGGNDVLRDIELVIGSNFGDEIHGSNRALNELIRGGGGNDTLFGGAETGTDLGNNFADYRFGAGAVNVNLSTNSATGADGNDQLFGFMGVFSGAFNDTLVGDAQDNFLDAGQGDDFVDGGAGLRDIASYQNATGSVNVNLATNSAIGADGNDTLANIEDVRGSESSDTLTGSDGDNRLQGRGGNDVIDGGAGNDSIHGGLGNDQLTGGTGNDVFQFGAAGEGTDTITDFTAGDVIRVGAALATTGVTVGDGAGLAGFGIQAETVGGVTTLSIDTDGVAGADLQITLQGTFAAADFDVVQGAGGTDISINGPVQGLPVIQGSVVEDQVLTASTSGLSDADGLGAFSYQWFRDGQAIVGSVAATYQLGDADVGGQMTVRVSYVDGKGNDEAAVSAPTVAVANVNDVPTGTVTIGGTAVEDGILTASNTLADADGLGTIAYQWFAGGNAIAGATTTSLTLTQAQVGQVITVTASYQDQQGHNEAVTSAATAAVQNVNDPVQGGVTISGTATQGATLTAANTLADEDGLGPIGYQWFADGAAISGATTDSLVLAQAQVGKAITVRASYVDGQGTAESSTSAATGTVANVNDAPTGGLAIGGFTAANPSKGQTLSVVNTVGDADGLGTFSYTWFNGTLEVGTGATYTLKDTDVGGHITVQGSYTDGFNTQETVTSLATGPVQPNSPPQGTVTIAGTFAQNATLTASQALSDADGLGAITFQWLAEGSAITGAIGSTFVLTEAQVGKTVTVQASYTDGLGTPESVSSTGQLVANVNDPLTGNIAISNTAPRQGDTLTAFNSFADVDGLGTVSYQWFADGTAIANATGTTFTPGQAQVDKVITVQGSYDDRHGTHESRTSSGTARVANVNDAATGTPVIGNTAPAQGQVLTVNTSSIADADGIGAFSFQWLAGGAVIAGATSSSLTLTQAQVDQAISVRVSFTDGFGSAESLTSAATAKVANVDDAPTGAVNVNGARVVGMPLHADASTVADPDGLGTFSFQWLRAGVAISGATADTYTPVADDSGQDVSVRVSYTDLFGHAEALTSGAVPVVNEDLVTVLVVNGVASVAGDGNGDGIKDSVQEAVVSAPLVVQGSTTAAPVFVTLVADSSSSGAVNQGSTAVIQTLNQEAAPEARPTTLDAPLGLIDFTAATTVGKTETFTLFVDSNLGVNGYWKQDDGGTWVNLASRPFGGSTTLVGNKIRLDFQITDGGTFDNDHQADGIITDPAIIGAMPLSIVGYAPDVTLTPTTHFFF